MLTIFKDNKKFVIKSIFMWYRFKVHQKARRKFLVISFTIKNKSKRFAEFFFLIDKITDGLISL